MTSDLTLAADSTARRPLGLRHGFMALLLMAVAACSHVQLIGDYDEVIDQSVTSVQKRTEAYFATLESTPSTPYSQKFYDDIKADLKTLATRAQAAPKSSLVEQQLTLLQTSFGQLSQLDKSLARPVTQDGQGRWQHTEGLATVEQQIGQIVKLELALKRGEPAAAGK